MGSYNDYFDEGNASSKLAILRAGIFGRAAHNEASCWFSSHYIMTWLSKYYIYHHTQNLLTRRMVKNHFVATLIFSRTFGCHFIGDTYRSPFSIAIFIFTVVSI